MLQAVGLLQYQYAGHRIWAAMSRALAEVEDFTIQTLGRWSSAAFLENI